VMADVGLQRARCEFWAGRQTGVSAEPWRL